MRMRWKWSQRASRPSKEKVEITPAAGMSLLARRKGEKENEENDDSSDCSGGMYEGRVTWCGQQVAPHQENI